MSYSRHFCVTMLDHYQHRLKSAGSDEEEAVIRRNIRMYSSQLKQYESAHLDTKRNHSDMLVAFFPAPEGLTFQERKAHKALSQIDSDSIWGCGIRVALAAQSASRFHQLIKELNEQIEDSPVAMRRILGKDAFEAVVKLGLTNV